MIAEPMHSSRGVRFGGETLTAIPASCVIRPLRHNVLLEPLDVIYSRYVYVQRDTKPLRGRVLAVGPGRYPIVYLDANGDRLPSWNRKARKQMTWSKHFQPTSVKVGQEVELGGAEHEGYAFELYSWGDKTVLMCTEEDICGVCE